MRTVRKIIAMLCWASGAVWAFYIGFMWFAAIADDNFEWRPPYRCAVAPIVAITWGSLAWLPFFGLKYRNAVRAHCFVLLVCWLAEAYILTTPLEFIASGYTRPESIPEFSRWKTGQSAEAEFAIFKEPASQGYNLLYCAGGWSWGSTMFLGILSLPLVATAMWPKS